MQTKRCYASLLTGVLDNLPNSLLIQVQSVFVFQELLCSLDCILRCRYLAIAITLRCPSRLWGHDNESVPQFKAWEKEAAARSAARKARKGTGKGKRKAA